MTTNTASLLLTLLDGSDKPVRPTVKRPAPLSTARLLLTLLDEG